MLHSGGRYAVTDQEVAAECASESTVLKRIASFCIEDTGGMFVALDEDDIGYADRFLKGCKGSGVRADEIGVSEALKEEPNLARDIRAAIAVPDASIDRGPGGRRHGPHPHSSHFLQGGGGPHHPGVPGAGEQEANGAA
jgi:glycerol-3-phosphate dehydrogenase